MIGEWIRFGLAALCVLAGCFALLTAMVGLFRFDFTLNRLHAASIADTLGLSLLVLAVMLAVGLRPVLWKLLLVVIPLIALSLMAVSVITYRVAKQNIQNRVSEYMEQYLLQLSSAIDNKLETSIQLNAQLSVNAQLSC